MRSTTAPPVAGPRHLAMPREPEPGDRLPRLSQGTQLLGEFQGSAFENRPYLLRRGDGQIIQISRLLYAIAETLPRAADVHDLAQQVSDQTGREVSPDNVAYLLTTKLRPLGVLGDAQAAPASKPLLSLRFRVRVLPETLHRRVTTALCPLFRPAVVLGVLAALVIGDLAVFRPGAGGVVGGVGQMINDPALLLILLALTLATAAFHETGHATATRYGGATPGVMGAGIYLLWPVFYTDVTDAYRLDRRGRLRTDLGGVYFNVVMLVVADAAYLATRFSALLVFIVVTHLEVLYQFLPFVRLDGYWVLSDLIGVPNLFAYLGPVTARLTGRLDGNGRRKLDQLRPWAQRAITAWVALTVAILATNAILITFIGPAIFRLTWHAGHARISQLLLDVGQGRILGAIDQPIALILGSIPAAGLLLLIGMLLWRAARAIKRWWPTRRPAAVALGLAVMAALGVQVPHLTAFHATRPAHPAATSPLAPAAASPKAGQHHPLPVITRPARSARQAARPTRPADSAQRGVMAPVAGARIAATPGGDGYWIATAGGSVQPFGNARSYGSAADITHPPIVAMAATPTGRGYWLAAADGAVYAYGDARYQGGMSDRHLNQPIVGIAASPGGDGYWLVAADGGVFTFGNASFSGSAANAPHSPIVSMAATPSGRGYWLAAADGAVYAYGDAQYLGGMSGHPLNQPVEGIAAIAGGDGYWLVAGDGGVFSFGDAPFLGSAANTMHAPVIGLVQPAGAAGATAYRLLTSDYAAAPLGP